MGIANKLSGVPLRRHLLTGGLAGGFMLAFHLPVRAANEPATMAYAAEGPFAPNAFIRIDTAGKTTLVMPQVEMGQGIYTAVAMILAEELDADFAQVVLQHAPPNQKLYANPLLGIQATGGSTSVRAFSQMNCPPSSPSARLAFSRRTTRDSGLASWKCWRQACPSSRTTPLAHR